MHQRGPISIGNYTFYQKEILGKGVTGNVYKGQRIQDQYPVAIKAINLKLNQNQVTLALLQTQIKTLKLIKPHPNLIKTIDIIQDQDFCFIITELYTGGTLKQFLQQSGVLLPEIALKIFHKIVAGYSAISDAFIIHRDLKPANIMLEQNTLEPVIIDFGFGEIIQTKTIMKAFNVGSPAYMSPEAFFKTLYSEKSDVWALGIILYEMLTGQTLDNGIETKRYFQILNDNFITQKIRPFEDIFKEILSQVLKMDPSERISIHKIKYILDKNSIMKMNNPMKTLHSSIQLGTSTQPLTTKLFEMNRSNVFQDHRNRQKRAIFQSGNFQMRNSISMGMNGSSNLTVFQSNNLKAKLAESRYRLNVLSPIRSSQNIENFQLRRSSIEKSNEFLSPKNTITLNPNSNNILITNKIEPVKNILSNENTRKIQQNGHQIIKFEQNRKNQSEYLPIQQNITNLISVPPKKHFKNTQTFTQSNTHIPIRQKIQNTYHSLPFQQSNVEQKMLVAKKSPNSKKFSFKKLVENQGINENQYFPQYKQPPRGKENIELRMDQKGQGFSHLYFKQNLYSSVHYNQNVTIRSYQNEPNFNKNMNMQIQQSLVRRIL